MTDSTNAKVSPYTPVQVALITAAIEANGGYADKAMAERLAADSRMDAGPDTDRPGPRTPRMIIAKISRMTDVEYRKATPVSKTGGPVQKKTELVNRIAERAGVAAGKLSGLENAPKLALETLFAALPVAANG